MRQRGVVQAWLTLPGLIREILAELRLLREFLGLLARPPIEAVVCACGHTSTSYATDPGSNTRTCLACYNAARTAERQAATDRYRESIRSSVRSTQETLDERRRRLDETQDQPRNRALREGLLVDIRTLEIALVVEQARLGSTEMT